MTVCIGRASRVPGAAIVVALSTVVLQGCSETSPESSSISETDAYAMLHSDSEIRGASYEQIIDDIKNLSQRHADLVDVVQYGTSVRGQPLTVFRIQDKTVQVDGKRPAALISEGIHGNEYLNITDRLPEAFLERSDNEGYEKFLAKGGVVYIVPVLNPDGYDDGRRTNANGVDLNRSFPIRANGYPGRDAPETKAIRDYVAKEVSENNLSLEVSMEYHCCIGALIEPWAYTRTPPPADVRQRAGQVADAMRAALGNELQNGTVHQILNYPPTSGGSDDYYLENYGRRAYSYEARSGGGEARYFEGHVDWWNQIFELALDGY